MPRLNRTLNINITDKRYSKHTQNWACSLKRRLCHGLDIRVIVRKIGSWTHYDDVIMSAMASQIANLANVYSTVYSRRRSKKTSKLCVTGLCEGNLPVTGEFPSQRASDAENVSIWWRHHEARSLLRATALRIGRACPWTGRSRCEPDCLSAMSTQWTPF